MGKLQELFDQDTQRALRDLIVGAFEAKIIGAGVSLSPWQRRRLRKAIEKGDLESLSFRFRSGPAENNLTVLFEESDLAALQGQVDKLIAELPELVRSTVEELASSSIDNVT